MRNTTNSQTPTYRKFFKTEGISNEVLLLFLIMILLFFVNLYSLIKNNVINTIYNILKRSFIRLMNSNIEFFKNIDINISRLEKDSKAFEKKKENKFDNSQCCYICLNKVEFEVLAGCFHSFCGFDISYFFLRIFHFFSRRMHN